MVLLSKLIKIPPMLIMILIIIRIMIRIIATIIFQFAFNVNINNVMRKNEGVLCVPLQKDEGLFNGGCTFFCLADNVVRNRCSSKLGDTY